MSQWLDLLRDPCGSPLSEPCYAGMDGGYLIRTTNVFTPVIGPLAGTPAVGSLSVIDYVLQFTPFNLSQTTGRIEGGQVKGAGIGLTSQGLVNFITQTNSAVKQFRPVACCLKWIPDGPYASRQGTVGLLSTPGMAFTSGTSASAVSELQAMQHVTSNGSEAHEVRWLPTNVDENFGTITSNNNIGAGTVNLVLSGVDGTVQSTAASNYYVSINGRIEVTVVWEWQPDNAGASQTAIAQTIRPPKPYTSQQVLSTIKDVAAFVYHGVRQAYPMASYAAERYLTGGVRQSIYRSPPMITY